MHRKTLLTPPLRITLVSPVLAKQNNRGQTTVS